MDADIARRDERDNHREGHAYEAAPIAARFEDCLQCFERLHGIVETNREPEAIRYPTIEGAFSKFRQWGAETRAPSRSLDHALRNASQLRQTTEDLLADLLSALQLSEYQSSHKNTSCGVLERTYQFRSQ